MDKKLNRRLLVPLNTWTSRHTGRYPDGIDLTPRSSTSDIYLRGEWEGTARKTAKQLVVKRAMFFRKKIFMSTSIRSDEPPSYRVRIESILFLLMILDLFGGLF